jgi:hypothetical protein
VGGPVRAQLLRVSAGPARRDDRALGALLVECDRYEPGPDPNGSVLPRVKRHDVKTLAVVETLMG